MEEVSIYGFGSFFNNETEFQDLDILLIHQSTKYSSCQFSLLCKRHLSSIIHNADVTILSCSEEHQNDFIEKSKAIYIGKVNENSVSDDLKIIITKSINSKHLNGKKTSINENKT